MLGVAIAVAFIFWTVAFMILEDRFIYFPEKYPNGAYDQARSIPNLRDCWATAEDGVRLHGWFAPAESARATFGTLPRQRREHLPPLSLDAFIAPTPL